MRAEEHRLAARAGFADATTKLALHQGIQAAGRFVEHEQWRPGGERGNERDLLPVAAGIRFAGSVEVEIETVDQLRTIRDVQAGPDVAEQLEDLGAGQRRPQRNVGGHVRDVAVGLADVACRYAEHVGGTGARTNKTEQQANCGGLACAVGTEEAEHLTWIDGETQVVDGDDVTERLAHAVDADSEFGSGASTHRGMSVHRMPFASRATDCRPDFPAHQM